MVRSSGKIRSEEPEKPTSFIEAFDKSRRASRSNKIRIAVDILESIDDYVSAFDRNWNFIYINNTTAQDFGLKPKDLLGKNIWKTFPMFLGTAIEKNYRETMYTRQIRRFEWKTIYATTRFEQFTVFPSADGITVYGVDITARKKAEEELYKNRELLRSIIDSADSIIIARDLDEKLILINKTESILYKMPIDKALGTTPYDIYPKKVADQIVAWDKKVISEGKSLRYEETLPIDGVLHTYVTNKFPLRDSQGKIYGLGGVITDITDRKRLETTLEQYSKNLEKLVEQRTMQLRDSERLAAIGQTAGMVGHDIRNPLQAMIGDVYLLKADLTGMPESKTKEEVAESLDSIEENIGYVNKIVADLQDYARQLKPEYAYADLADLIISVFETINIPDGVKLSFDVKGFPKLRTDPTFIRRALTNLVNNAIQAMPNGGRLEVTAFERNSKAYITVSDSGIGIPEAIKPKLFTPMVTSKAKGQGLGLAVVKRLIDALGGAITFESEMGKGTKFIIELPCEKAKA